MNKTSIFLLFPKKSVIFLFSVFLLFGFSKTSLVNYSPRDGAVINNNMPNLTWSRTNCNYFEIWIDGKKMGKVQGNQNAYTPFGLSYGNHEWQVIAFSKGGKSKSLKTTFTIKDAPLENLPENAILLREGWNVQSSAVIKMEGKELSTKKINAKRWYSTSLPSTVLTTLVRNGVYPNPNIGMNNMLIPDCNNEFNTENNLLKYSHIKRQNPWTKKYWFRKEFSITTDQLKQNLWLNIGEINYRAEVWLNGGLLADTAEMAGMERSFRFNITDKIKVNEPNILAIAIYPPNHPEKPDPALITPLADTGVNMVDSMNSKDYTKWDALGYDRQPDVRDRDMGITKDVYLTTIGDLELTDIHVKTDLPLPDTTSAEVTISANLINHSDVEKQGIVSAKVIIDNQEFSVERPFKIAPISTSEIIFKPTEFEALMLKNPKIWWPFGYGDQNLYTTKLEAKTNGEVLSNIETKFGVREVETYIGSKERVFKINGQEIYIKGGNWLIDRYINWTASRYVHEIRLIRNAGLNFLRVCGSTGYPPTVLYEAADKYGVLIWYDYQNDFRGTIKNIPEYTPNYDNVIRKNYGAPESAGKKGVKEYVEKCQVLDYEIYRSSIEAINSQIRNNTRGYTLRKSNSSWPSFVRQVYDWDMQANAGYYATQKANEMVHIQLNRANMEIDVLNVLPKEMNNCRLKATLFNSKMAVIWSENKYLSLEKNTVTKPGLTVPKNNELNFLVLKIENSTGKLISENFYWLNQSNDFKSLKDIPQPRLMCSVSKVETSDRKKVTVTIKNYGNNLAFMVALKLVGEKSGTELQPSYWNNNYINILPGQTIDAIVEIDKSDISEKPVLEVTAYNMKETLRLVIP